MSITQEQRELRRKYLGASDVAAVLGAHPFRSAADVRLDKLGLLDEPDASDAEAVDIGNDSEPYSVEWAAAKLGCHSPREAMCDRTFVASNGVMCSHPDGLLEHDEGAEPIEAKYSGLIDQWGMPGEQRVPQQHYIQLVSQMICIRSECKVDRGHISVFLPSYKHRRRLYTFAWCQKTADLIEKHCTEWWDRHIRQQEECSGPPSLEVAKRIRFAGDETTASVAVAHAEALIHAAAAKSVAIEEWERAQATVLADLNGAAIGVCPGFVIRNRLIERSGYEVAATEYRQLTCKKAKGFD